MIACASEQNRRMIKESPINLRDTYRSARYISRVPNGWYLFDYDCVCKDMSTYLLITLQCLLAKRSRQRSHTFNSIIIIHRIIQRECWCNLSSKLLLWYHIVMLVIKWNLIDKLLVHTSSNEQFVSIIKNGRRIMQYLPIYITYLIDFSEFSIGALGATYINSVLLGGSQYSPKENVNKIKYRSIHHYILSHLSSQMVSFRHDFSCIRASHDS